MPASALPTPVLVTAPTTTAALLVFGLAVLFGLVALGFLGSGVLSLSRWRHLRQGRPGQFRATLDGPIEVEGTAQPADDADPFNAAVSQTSCLVSEIEAQVYESDGSGSSSWTTREARTTTRPFVVDSDAGRIRVEPDGAELLLSAEIVDELDGGEEATGRTAAFFEAVGIDRTAGSVDLGITELDYGSRCRIREHRVDVGEDVYVAGTGLTDDPEVGGFGGPDAVIRAPADRSLSERLFGFPFVIGDGGESAVRRHFFRRGLLYTAIGLVFGVVWAGLIGIVVF